MFVQKLAALALLGSMTLPFAAEAQYHRRHYSSYNAHERAKAAQRASDHHHHTGAKIVVGSAAGGAVVGGLLGGGKGALIGGALGAGGGALVNKNREHRDVRKREATGRY